MNRNDPRRRLFGAGVGAGTSSDDPLFTSACSQVMKDRSTPAQFLPIIHDVQASFQGPIKTADANKLFAVDMQPFSWGPDTIGPTEISTTLWSGQPIAPFMVYYIGVHIEPTAFAFTADGNFTLPFTDADDTYMASPDDYTKLDKTNGSFSDADGNLLDVSNNLFPAVLRYGSAWQAAMMYHFVRSRNYNWKVNSLTSIVDNLLRTLAYTPNNVQNGSASSSEADYNSIVEEMNFYYQQLGATGWFRKFDRTRTGCTTTAPTGIAGATVAPWGNFVANRDDLAGVTYGAAAVASALLRDLKNNSEYFKLEAPYLIKDGVPPGVMLRVIDDYQNQAFLKAVSVSEASNPQQNSLIPPYVSDFGDSAGGAVPGYDNGATEQALDATTTYRQQRDLETYVYKYGFWKMRFNLVGRDLTADEYACVTDPANRAALRDATGTEFPYWG
jgi:hypothetical protein